MSNELVVRLCAPTLAGIKSGSMFSCPMDSRRELLEHVRRYNRMLVPKGLCMLPLRYTGKNALIYVFRPARLQKDLAVREARSILESYGYEREDPLGCIIKLMRRMQDGENFPHEVGLFLSYPPEDVRGFIDNKGKNCKCFGMWKVYGDETEARRKFDNYRKCTEIYCKRLAGGTDINTLTLAV